MSILFNNNITMLVCDMAGTILKENGTIYKTLFNTLNNMNYPVTKQDKKYWQGKDKFKVLETHISRFELEDHYKIKTNIAKQLLMKELDKEYFENNGIKLIDPNLPLFFEKLRLHNIKIALNTGYPEDFQKKLIDKFDLDLYIEDSISSEKLKYGRPYPFMIHRLMENSEVENVANVAKIGDTINDMKEGKNAGCGLVIGVLSGDHTKRELKKAGADIVIDNIMNLDDEIQSLNGFFL